MWIVRLALRRPYTVAVFSALIFIAGLLSVTRMRTDIFPSIDIPVVVVVWNYPGLSAEDMERRIVLISERAYSTTVDGITHIESQSIAGVGPPQALLRAGRRPRHRDRPDHLGVARPRAGSCPPGSSPPTCSGSTPATCRWRRSTSPATPLGEQQLFDYGLNFLRVRLFTIPGTSIPGALRRQAAADHGGRGPERHRGQGPEPQRRGAGAAPVQRHRPRGDARRSAPPSTTSS